MDPNEVGPFLKKIAADPTSITARMIFADWLEERGESRAFFIRAQIALANDILEPLERAELAGSASNLYWKHHRYWNGDIYRQWIGTPLEGHWARAAGLRGWYYRQGFPEVLDVSAELFVQHFELFAGVAPFREVYLRRPPPPVDVFMAAHEKLLSRIERLILPRGYVIDLKNMPKGLAHRVRIGYRAQQTLAEFLKHPTAEGRHQRRG